MMTGGHMRPHTHDNALVLGNLREYRNEKKILPQKVSVYIFNHFYVMRPESYRIR